MMPVCLHVDISFTLRALFIALLTFAFIQARGALSKTVWGSRVVVRNDEPALSPVTQLSRERKGATESAVLETEGDEVRLREMQCHKTLYFKLQHLEQFPEVLPQARDLLIFLFSETLTDACKKAKSGILCVEHYTPESLASFLQSENEKIMHEWEEYLGRRKTGNPTEMFRDRKEAQWWLKQIAPVKYVDGAWLGHVNKITTPFALRRASKDAWQVLSEELGDGDLAKNHVHIYHELMEEVEPGLPEGDSADFIHPRHQINKPSVWKAAIAQLLISLFPHDFLPEILGFNLHYELITLDTLKAAKELKELKLNAYYFILHISIDNADSGHTAIAMHTVMAYMEQIRSNHGDRAAQKVWKRIQAGYILSEGLPTAPGCPSLKTPAADLFPRNEHEKQVINIFKAKAPVAHKIHCSSRMKIGRQTLVNWLNPNAFMSRQWQMDFLNDLRSMRPWVSEGDSRNSKLIQAISWPGIMFGSFTQNEVEVIKRWIDSLGNSDPRFYWLFTGQAEITSDQAFRSRDIRADYPVFSPVLDDRLPAQPSAVSVLPSPALNSTIQICSSPDISRILPLWFTHPCLLESFISVPAKTTSKTGSAVVRLLRAQYGFGVEGSGVAGMDEARRIESIGLVELGQEMMKRSGLPALASLKEVLETWPSEFALWMLHASMRPIENAGLLLGLAWAFMDFHKAMTSCTLLSASGQGVLAQIARRERDSLEVCLKEVESDQVRYADFCRGYHLGRGEVEGCFHKTGL
ncbi:PqqC-like protein [Lasallia pustulata]|uniref:PqqC-like protein n=1 Tax=Lasallia pustulata TaxID=136370 RepID=A0A1W5CYC1_9LECA|nr:PqqC-like protein [Lasallia pustulata]